MLRLLLLLALVPAAVAAPVPPGGRDTFGPHGLLTHADLEKVHFDSRPAKGRDDLDKLREPEADEPKEAVKDDPAKVRPKNRYDVAVHLPWATFRAGEPVPAHFVLRNNRAAVFGMPSRFDLSGEWAHIRGGHCAFDVRDRATGKSVVRLHSGSTNCGGGYLAEVPGDGFYCVRGDLNRVAGQTLPPGEYEVDWRYGELASAPVTFTVVKGDGTKPLARAERRGWRIFSVAPEFEAEEHPERAGEPFRWRATYLNSVSADNLAAALAVGPGGAYIPDIHTIPAADKLVEASVEWRPYRDGDRVIVTLHAAAPHKSVRFAEAPKLHLQLEADEERLRWAMQEEAKRGQDEEMAGSALATPLTVEARLPADWRTRGASGAARVAVLVTATEIELPRGGLQREKAQQKLDKVSRAIEGDSPPVWGGIVRTAFTELRFPLAMPVADSER